MSARLSIVRDMPYLPVAVIDGEECKFVDGYITRTRDGMTGSLATRDAILAAADLIRRTESLASGEACGWVLEEEDGWRSSCGALVVVKREGAECPYCKRSRVEVQP